MTPSRWLLVTALAYALTHHLGALPGGLGRAGHTRWTDWIDLLTPYAVLVPAALALWTARARTAAWAIFLVGAIAYTDGHGIHLSANSIGNVAPGEAVHLWDEVVGHYLWYAGVTLVFAALALTLAGRTAARGPLPHVAALAVGLTLATNALEGGTVPLALATAVLFTVWGRRVGEPLLITAFTPTLVLLTAYGTWQRGFPQPSELGWI
jgi:hypothetical protein